MKKEPDKKIEEKEAISETTTSESNSSVIPPPWNCAFFSHSARLRNLSGPWYYGFQPS